MRRTVPDACANAHQEQLDISSLQTCDRDVSLTRLRGNRKGRKFSPGRGAQRGQRATNASVHESAMLGQS